MVHMADLFLPTLRRSHIECIWRGLWICGSSGIF